MTDPSVRPARQRVGAEGIDPGAEAALRQMLALLRERGRAADADDIRRRRMEAARSVPSLVVVGELSAGKTTLVNALVRMPGLLPTGIGETTAVPVTVTPSLEVGRAELHFAGSTRTVTAAEVKEWVAVDGARASDAADLTGVRVGGICDGLPGVAVTDTPGASALNELHARLAILRAESASVLLMVVDGGARLTRHALDFLQSCAASVEAVVIVANKIDGNPGWQTIVDENRRIVETTRFAGTPIVGISALRAESAQAQPDPGRARRLIEASNTETLIRLLASRFERVKQLPTLNALRQSRTALEQLLTLITEERLAASGSPDALRVLAARRDRLVELQQLVADQRWDFPKIMTRLRGDVSAEVDARVDEFRQEWLERVKKSKLGHSKRIATALEQQLRAEAEVLEAQVRLVLTEHAAGALDRLYGGAGLAVPAGLSDVVAPVRHHQPGSQAPDGFGALKGVSLGLMGAALVRTVGGSVLSPILIPLNIVALGAGIFAGTRLANQRQLTEFVMKLHVDLSRSLTRYINDAVGDLQAEIGKAYTAALGESVKQAREHLATAQRAGDESDRARADRLTAIDDDIREIRGLLDGADAAVRRILGNIPARPPLQVDEPQGG